MLLPLLSACLEATVPAGSCGDCHSDAGSSAPFVAPGGVTATDARGAGAHTAHLWAPRWSRPAVCADCHPAYDAVGDEGHLDPGGPALPADVTWAASDLPNGSSEPYDAGALTCVVYCHGAASTKGPDEPAWTAAEPVACDSCHGVPPPTPDHDGMTADTDCSGCHTAPAGGWDRGDPALHVDGRLQLDLGGGGTVPGSCAASCHGTDDDPAPPPDTHGETDPALPSVGAHATHVGGTGAGAAVACADCHVVPGAVGDPGHLDGAPAEVALSGVAARGGHAPTYAATTCADTYCHAGPGATEPEPDWTAGAGAPLACDACHGAPPPAPHPASPACASCHPTAGPGPSITDPARHADGRVDL